MAVKIILNAVVLLALAATAKASLIVDPVYGDGEVKESHSLHSDCSYRACDELCRRLGFSGGACVNEKCKCITPLTGSEVIHEVDDTHVNNVEEDNNDSTKDQPEAKLAPRYCSNMSCLSMCHRLGYIGGSCWLNVCQCY